MIRDGRGDGTPDYNWILLGLGIAFLTATVLPRVLKGIPVSLPMVYLASGLLLGLFWGSSNRRWTALRPCGAARCRVAGTVGPANAPTLQERDRRVWIRGIGTF